MGKYKAKVEETTTTRVDPNTGEILESTQKKTFFVKKESEPFFQTYLSYISWIYEIKGIVPIQMLCKFMEMAAFNKNDVTISTNTRRQLIQELKISESAFTKGLKELLNRGVLEGEKGSYHIHEGLLWKGDRDEREKLLNARANAKMEFDENDQLKLTIEAQTKQGD